METLKITQLIGRAPWREAVTYRDSWPHEYVLSRQHPRAVEHRPLRRREGMAEIDTLLAHLSPSFTSQTENIAVAALGYILNKYAGSREGLDDVVRSGVRNVNPVVKVNTPVTALDGTRPDLVGVDEGGAERVLIEAKFWAELTRRQPDAYLERLPDVLGGVVAALRGFAESREGCR